MDGIKNLLTSEHGIFGVLLILGATVLCALKIMTVEDWKNFAQVIFVTFTGAHALVTSAAHFSASRLPQMKTNPETKEPS